MQVIQVFNNTLLPVLASPSLYILLHTKRHQTLMAHPCNIHYHFRGGFLPRFRQHSAEVKRVRI